MKEQLAQQLQGVRARGEKTKAALTKIDRLGKQGEKDDWFAELDQKDDEEYLEAAVRAGRHQKAISRLQQTARPILEDRRRRVGLTLEIGSLVEEGLLGELGEEVLEKAVVIFDRMWHPAKSRAQVVPPPAAPDVSKKSDIQLPEIGLFEVLKDDQVLSFQGETIYLKLSGTELGIDRMS